MKEHCYSVPFVLTWEISYGYWQCAFQKLQNEDLRIFYETNDWLYERIEAK